MHIRQLRGWLIRLFGLFHRKRREREFAAELESHLAMHIEDNLRAGMSPEEARRVALTKLGGVALTQELHREQRELQMLETLLQDMRYGLRMLRKNPGFSLIAILTLALGIGANSTIFSWINSTLLDPIPGIADTSDMITITRGERSEHPTPPFSYLDFADLRDSTRIFTGLLAYHDDYMTITGSDKPERIYGALVSSNYFEVLGVRPILGRSLEPTAPNERLGTAEA